MKAGQKMNIVYNQSVATRWKLQLFNGFVMPLNEKFAALWVCFKEVMAD
jgi:hypothetical protein